MLDKMSGAAPNLRYVAVYKVCENCKNFWNKFYCLKYPMAGSKAEFYVCDDFEAEEE